MNRNYKTVMDATYVEQQEAIKSICEELGLILFRPNYHADKTDCNTVMIYTKEADEFNKTLPSWASNDEYAKPVCYLENTDCNGHFDLNFFNRGKVDCRCNMRNNLKAFIHLSLNSSLEWV